MPVADIRARDELSQAISLSETAFDKDFQLLVDKQIESVFKMRQANSYQRLSSFVQRKFNNFSVEQAKAGDNFDFVGNFNNLKDELNTAVGNFSDDISDERGHLLTSQINQSLAQLQVKGIAFTKKQEMNKASMFLENILAETQQSFEHGTTEDAENQVEKLSGVMEQFKNVGAINEETIEAIKKKINTWQQDKIENESEEATLAFEAYEGPEQAFNFLDKIVRGPHFRNMNPKTRVKLLKKLTSLKSKADGLKRTDGKMAEATKESEDAYKTSFESAFKGEASVEEFEVASNKYIQNLKTQIQNSRGPEKKKFVKKLESVAQDKLLFDTFLNDPKMFLPNSKNKLLNSLEELHKKQFKKEVNYIEDGRPTPEGVEILQKAREIIDNKSIGDGLKTAGDYEKFVKAQQSLVSSGKVHYDGYVGFEEKRNTVNEVYQASKSFGEQFKGLQSELADVLVNYNMVNKGTGFAGATTKNQRERIAHVFSEGFLRIAGNNEDPKLVLDTIKGMQSFLTFMESKGINMGEVLGDTLGVKHPGLIRSISILADGGLGMSSKYLGFGLSSAFIGTKSDRAVFNKILPRVIHKVKGKFEHLAYEGLDGSDDDRIMAMSIAITGALIATGKAVTLGDTSEKDVSFDKLQEVPEVKAIVNEMKSKYPIFENGVYLNGNTFKSIPQHPFLGRRPQIRKMHAQKAMATTINTILSEGHTTDFKAPNLSRFVTALLNHGSRDFGGGPIIDKRVLKSSARFKQYGSGFRLQIRDSQMYWHDVKLLNGEKFEIYNEDVEAFNDAFSIKDYKTTVDRKTDPEGVVQFKTINLDSDKTLKLFKGNMSDVLFDKIKKDMDSFEVRRIFF